MKYKIGTLLSLGLNRIIFDTDGKCYSCKCDDIFIVTDANESGMEYTVLSVRGFYSQFVCDTFEDIFRAIDV